MSHQHQAVSKDKNLQELILQEKAKGIPDIEIGKKYGVTFRYIERLITKTHGLNISALNYAKKIKNLQPKNFIPEQTTVWSFKQRGNWASHSGEYRGNWSPYIPRNVILRYSNPGDLVLDYFCGAGTTAVECKLLGRRCRAIDINEKAIDLARKNINFDILFHSYSNKEIASKIYEPELIVGDARDLSFIEDNSIDLICSHPPYANIIHYTDSKENDLSFLHIDEFLREMAKVAAESYRVLKHGKQCAILIGDTRRKKYVIPLGFALIDVYLTAGFKLRELIIKRQHNCKTTGFWYANSIKYNFLLLAHEYLPIFEKPKHTVFPITENKIVANSLSYTTITELPLKEKLVVAETTTAWVLPNDDFESSLNRNVIDRYAKNKKYSVLVFTKPFKNDVPLTIKNDSKTKKELLFLKFAFLEDNISFSEINSYLVKTKEIIIENLPFIVESGHIVIQTKDVRSGIFIEPLAKKLVDFLSIREINLKEIIIVTKENSDDETETANDCLKIVHQYLLVYEVKHAKS
ncbi:MAG: DNA methyltransferase [bacterium]|nr:DNA methyltransferase [bacterium]